MKQKYKQDTFDITKQKGRVVLSAPIEALDSVISKFFGDIDQITSSENTNKVIKAKVREINAQGRPLDFLSNIPEDQLIWVEDAFNHIRKTKGTYSAKGLAEAIGLSVDANIPNTLSKRLNAAIAQNHPLSTGVCNIRDGVIKFAPIDEVAPVGEIIPS